MFGVGRCPTRPPLTPLLPPPLFRVSRAACGFTGKPRRFSERWRSGLVSCFKNDEEKSSLRQNDFEFTEIRPDAEFQKPEVKLDGFSDEPELDISGTSNECWNLSIQKVLKKVFLFRGEPWTVPWTAETIVQVMLLWISSFWFVGSWIIPFLAHAAGFSKESLTHRGQALYSLLTDLAEGLAGIAILHRCLAKFRPLPAGWFRFSLGGAWHFDVGLACLLFPLVNFLSQLNINIIPVLPAPPVGISSVEQSIIARDPVAMALYAVVVSVCAPIWEEIVFRGFLLPSLTKYMPLWCAVVGAHMDALQQISNESFSHGWLNSSIKPSSFDCLEDSSSFIEMDPDWFSMRWTGLTDFDFNLPSFESSVMAHADQIFSDGHLLPLHLGNPLKSKEASGSTDSMLKRSVSLDSSKRLLSSISASPSPILLSSQFFPLRSGEDNENNKLPLIRPGAKSPGRILRKYLYFIIPLFKKVKSFKLISSRSVRSCGDSPRSSARTMNNGFSAIERRRINRVFDVDTESSIHEAVLHCKKSNGSSTEEA